MTHASLFSGIGGPELAAAMMGWQNVFHCEINPFGRAVLEFHFPESDSYDDITKTDFTRYRGQIDVLTGGFPCQPFSYAGKRGGQSDDRYLWPEMLRVIDEIRPTWVVGENVAGITTMVESCEVVEVGSEGSLFEETNRVHRFRSEQTFTIERICSDLESKGYSVQPMLIPACAVGAPHRRDRIFIIAYNTDCGDDMRGSGENAGKEREERICERNEIRIPGESDNVRSSTAESSTNSQRMRLQHNMVGGSKGGMPEKESIGGKRGLSEQIQFVEAIGEREPATDTASGGSQSLSQSERAEGHRSNEFPQPGERRDKAKFDNGFSGISRIVTDSDSNGGGEIHKHFQSSKPDGSISFGDGWIGNAAKSSFKYSGKRIPVWNRYLPSERWKTFPSVSPVHRGNDGLPFDVDDLTISFGKWRTESIKAYGNAIVPQVMYRIFQAIESHGN